jgi:inosine-uridine nucleoside N-ribohydrolase
MQLWIDTDAGTNPDDTVALWCAARARSEDVSLVGVSTVDGDVDSRAAFVRSVVPSVEVFAGAPPVERLANVDVLLAIGPWTHVADLADAGALPRRVVLMGGALAPVRHRGRVYAVEHNVGADPAAAARLLASTGNLIVVPLDATAQLAAPPHDEQALVGAVPGLRDQLVRWRAESGPLPLVLHDVAALLIALGDRVARMESRRLEVGPDGSMSASVRGPLQHVVAHVNGDETRARMRELAVEGD